MLEGRVCYWMMSNPFRFIEGQTHLAPLRMPKWIWPSMNQKGMFFVQTSTLPPSMHRKLAKHGRVVRKTTNSSPEVMLSWRTTLISHGLYSFYNSRTNCLHIPSLIFYNQLLHGYNQPKLTLWLPLISEDRLRCTRWEPISINSYTRKLHKDHTFPYILLLWYLLTWSQVIK